MSRYFFNYRSFKDNLSKILIKEPNLITFKRKITRRISAMYDHDFTFVPQPASPEFMSGEPNYD